MNFKLLLLFTVFILPLLSCEKNCDESISISGEWQWVRSAGYWGVLTPEKEGYDEILKFDPISFTRFRNGGIVEKQEYEILERTYLSGVVYYVIHFDSGLEYIMDFEGGQLTFSEFQWSCGFDHFYIRKF